MSTSLEWHKFYFKRWENDEFVKTADTETLGVYILLISHQMGEGDIPDNPDKLAVIVGHQITAERFRHLWLEKELSTKFHPVNERWVSTGRELDDGYWEAIEQKPGRLHNKFTTKVMTIDKKNWASRSMGGKKSGEIRASRSLEAAAAGTWQEEGEVNIDIRPILAAYPKRTNNHLGWEMGKKMVEASVSSQEDFNRLMAAVKAFSRETKSYPRDKIKRLDNFMREWEDWVPKSYSAAAEVSPTPEAPAAKVEAQAPKRYPPTWLVPEAPVRQLKPGEVPPWIVDTYDISGRTRAREQFPDDETKRRWWMTESDSEQPAAGA
jgi:hypothetical protein